MRAWLKEARIDKRLTQDDVSEKADIAPSFYNMIENGNRRPSVEVAKRIAEILNFEWTRFYEKEESERSVKKQ